MFPACWARMELLLSSGGRGPICSVAMNAGSLVDLQDHGLWMLTNVGKGKMTTSANLLACLVLACMLL